MMPATPRTRYTVVTDFDGVLHQYDGDWQGAAVIPGDPVPGAIDWLLGITAGFDVAVLSTRSESAEGRDAVVAWLVKHGVPLWMLMPPPSTSDVVVPWIRVTAHKPPALIYLDDRAVRFTGENWPTVHEVHAARPWWKP